MIKFACCYIPEDVQFLIIDGQIKSSEEIKKLSCQRKAEWEIAYGEDIYNYAHACTKHVGDLLSDLPEHRIYHIGQ